ncbi:MAG: sugar phosphate isomerase/epimerase family protein [Patescibacteria group bacterium]|nr:sugar phosphate isomerase/epimerase family protein [Patescibacteria group bacterium]
MVKLSVNELTTFRWSLEEDVAAYAAAGIPAIGVWRQKLSDYGLDRAAQLLAEHKIEASHLFWAGGFTGSDGRTYRESVHDACDAVLAAAGLKASCLVICSGARAGHTLNHANRLLRDALAEVIPCAEEHGVVLAVEPMHPGAAADCSFLTSLNDAMRLLDAIDSPSVKLVLDTYHLGQDPTLPARIPEIAPRIALVQLGDARRPPAGEQNRCLLTEGVLPLREIVAALKAAQYDGYYDVELLGEDVEACDYPSLLDHAKAAYADLVGE